MLDTLQQDAVTLLQSTIGPSGLVCEILLDMRQTLQSGFVLLPYTCRGLECQQSPANEDTSVFATQRYLRVVHLRELLQLMGTS